MHILTSWELSDLEVLKDSVQLAEISEGLAQFNDRFQVLTFMHQLYHVFSIRSIL